MRFNRPTVIARSEATKQSSFLRCAKEAGLLRFARNDVERHASSFSRRVSPEFCKFVVPLPKKRAQGMPGARCTRGLVCQGNAQMAHTSIQVSGEHTDIPCAMALRLIPRSPRRRIRLVTVTGGLRSCAPGRARIASAGLAPATGARTTRLHRTLRASFVDRTPESRSRGSSRPAIPRAPDAPRPPHPVAYVK